MMQCRILGAARPQIPGAFRILGQSATGYWILKGRDMRENSQRKVQSSLRKLRPTSKRRLDPYLVFPIEFVTIRFPNDLNHIIFGHPRFELSQLWTNNSIGAGHDDKGYQGDCYQLFHNRVSFRNVELLFSSWLLWLPK
jgi:hypothetical protein